MAVSLGDPVRRQRRERRRLVLGCLDGLAEDLARRRLVEANRRIDLADRLEHRRHADGGELGRLHRLVPRAGHERRRREIEDLGRSERPAAPPRAIPGRADRRARRQVGRRSLPSVSAYASGGRRTTPKTSYPRSSRSSASNEPSCPPIPVISARRGPLKRESARDSTRESLFREGRLTRSSSAGTGCRAGRPSRRSSSRVRSTSSRASSSSAWRPVTASPPPEQWRPPIAVRHLALPRIALYESWHYLRRPRVEAATGPVDVIHATGIVMPPPTSPLVLTVHDLSYLDYPELFTRQGLRFFHRALELAATGRVARALLLPWRRWSAAGRPASRTTGSGTSRSASAAARAAPGGRGAGATGRTHCRSGLILWTGTVEPRKNLGGPDPRLLLARYRRRPRARRASLAGTRTSTGLLGELDDDEARPGPPTRLGSARGSRGALRGCDGHVLPEPARRVRLPRRRGDGAGHSRRHLAGNVDRRARQRRRRTARRSPTTGGDRCRTCKRARRRVARRASWARRGCGAPPTTRGPAPRSSSTDGLRGSFSLNAVKITTSGCKHPLVCGGKPLGHRVRRVARDDLRRVVDALTRRTATAVPR